MDTLLRHWTMLRQVPRHPRKISTAELKERLTDRGYPTTLRTIQRDLDKLTMAFPLTSDGNNPSGWSWQEEAEIFDVPGMDTTEALTFCMVESFLSHMLPQGCLSAISPHLKRAHKVIEQNEGTSFQVWPSKVRTVQRSQPLLTAEILPEVMNTVYEALFYDRQMIGDYKKFGSKETEEYVINPLGLVFVDPTIYLVGSRCLWDEPKVRSLPLHRFYSARMLEDDCCPPKDFDLDQFLEKWGGGFPVTENADKIKLQFHIQKDVAQHLEETPLSEDQVINKRDEESFTIEATVQDTYRLRRWLLGFEDKVEIVKPAYMRRYFAGITRRMYQLYSDH